MKFPRKHWVEISHNYLCDAMDWEYVGEDDPESAMKAILARIEYAEYRANERVAKIVLEIEGLELV